MTETPRERPHGQGELGLEDADFWADPLRTRDEIEDRLFEKGESRLLLDAPRAVPLGVRQTCPVAILRFTTLLDVNQLPSRHALVTAMDLRNNLLFAAPVIPPSGDLVRLPSDDEPPSPAFSGEAFCLDLREHLSLPWEPGVYLITVILRERVSERVRVELKAPPTYQDPDVQRYLEERRRLTPPSAISPAPPPLPPSASGQPPPSSPSRRSPDYYPSADSPAPPESIGMVFSAPRVAALSARPSSLLRCSFRLPVREIDLVGRPGGQVLLPEGADLFEHRPSAVVPITLLFTGSETVVPAIVRLAVPSFWEADRSSGQPVVKGTFAIPFGLLTGLPKVAETAFLYAFSGETMVGPIPIASVDG